MSAHITFEMDFDLYLEIEYTINKRGNINIISARIKGIVIPLNEAEKELICIDIQNALDEDESEEFETFFSLN